MVLLLRTVTHAPASLVTVTVLIFFVQMMLSAFAVQLFGWCHVEGVGPYSPALIVLGSWVGARRPFHLSLFLTAPRMALTQSPRTAGHPRFLAGTSGLPRRNFFSFGEAFLTHFVIMTGSGVTEAALNYMQCADTPLVALYFAFAFALMNYVLLNIFIAMILKNFCLSEECVTSLVTTDERGGQSLVILEGPSLVILEGKAKCNSLVIPCNIRRKGQAQFPCNPTPSLFVAGSASSSSRTSSRSTRRSCWASSACWRRWAARAGRRYYYSSAPRPGIS